MLTEIPFRFLLIMSHLAEYKNLGKPLLHLPISMQLLECNEEEN